MKITEVAVRRRVTVAMCYIAVTVFGLIALDRIPIDLMPELELPALSVITVYPGAAAPDVEEKVSEPLEDVLGATANLQELTSVSKENISSIVLRFAYGTDLNEAADNIRQGIEWAKMYLPEDADPPALFQFDMSELPVLILTVTTSEGDIFDYRDFIEDRVMGPLERVPGVGSVQLINAPEKEVLVEVDREKLEAKHLTLQHVVDILKLENATVPAGHLTVGSEELAVRMPAEFRNLQEIRDVVLLKTEGGETRLRDIATVRASKEELRERAEGVERADPNAKKADGSWRWRKAVVLMIMKQSDANTAAVAGEIKEKIKELERTLPSNLRVSVAQDMSRFIVTMIDNLGRTVVAGGLLVILVAFMFLRRFRASMIVALSIPASMIIAFLVLYMGDYTLNMVSMMAMALAIGLVVDNGIVVLENVSRHVEMGVESDVAAVRGTEEVGSAIVASTLTTVSIFAPLVFVSGLVGVMFGQLALVMTVTIVASLITAIVMTPTLCAGLLTPKKRKGWFASLSRTRRDEDDLNRVERVYTKVLRWALRHRVITLLLAVGLVASTLELVRRVGFDFMPQGSEGIVQVVAELPNNTSLDESAAVGRHIAGAFLDDPETSRIFYQAGTGKMAFGAAFGGKEGSNVVQVHAQLTPPGERTRTDKDILDDVREKVKDLPEIVKLDTRLGSMISGLMQGMGKPVTIEILGEDYDEMETAAKKVFAAIQRTEGTEDAVMDLYETKDEIVFHLDRSRAATAMVPALSAGGALRTAFHGQQAGKFTGEGDSRPIIVRFEDRFRETTEDISRIQAASMTRRPVSLDLVGEVKHGKSPIQIRHKDKQRLFTVGSGVADRPIGDIAADLEGPLQEISKQHPNLTVRFGGTIEEQKETFADLLLVLLLGFALVYMVMASQFEALIDPFVIMFAIPFAITGAFLGLVVTGTTLSIPAFLGVIILLGIVVNNAIVLIDYVNLMRSRGMPINEAIVLGGARRLRPVLMTACTTIAGMLPLAYATGEGAETWGPMGRAVVGGLVVSTVVTLILVPALYRMTEPLRRKFKGEKAAVQASEPATASVGE